MNWVMEVPDVSVTVCLELIDQLLQSKKPNSGLLTLQQTISSAAFTFEHPEQANDPRAVSAAGLRGVIRAYSRVVQADAKSRLKSLDDLAAMTPAEFDAFLTEGLAKCEKEK